MRALAALASLIGLALALAPAPAAAQQRLPPPFCIVRAGPIDFGAYEQFDPGETTAIGRILVNCQGNNSRFLKVSFSAGASGNFYDRVMYGGRNGALHYNLYIDPAHRFVAGDGSIGTSPLRFSFTTQNDHIIFPYFAAIPPRQSAPAGEYTDEIRVEIEF